MQRMVVVVAAFVLAICGGVARAADDVVIGALYPMTGPNAQVGNDAKVAMETAAEIINGKHDIPMLLGKGGGLDRLGGAKLRLIFADHQGDPQKARAEAERLITQEHVVALIGSIPERDRGDHLADRGSLRGAVHVGRQLVAEFEPARVEVVLPHLTA